LKTDIFNGVKSESATDLLAINVTFWHLSVHQTHNTRRNHRFK